MLYYCYHKDETDKFSIRLCRRIHLNHAYAVSRWRRTSGPVIIRLCHFYDPLTAARELVILPIILELLAVLPPPIPPLNSLTKLLTGTISDPIALVETEAR